MHPPVPPLRRLAAIGLLTAGLLLLGGCSSLGKFFAFLGGNVVVTEAQLQERLDRRHPRDFEAGDGFARLTLLAPRVRLHADTLSLSFDLQAALAGLRLPLHGHLGIESGLRFDQESQALFLDEPRLVRIELPRVPGMPDQDELMALGDQWLADYARSEPVYVLSERRQQQVPMGRSIYRVDIGERQLVIGVRR